MDPYAYLRFRIRFQREVDMKPSVLIVDDERAIRHVLTEMLSEPGLPALEASDASEALNTLGKAGRDVGVIVTDVRMPGFLNGLDLAKLVQNAWPWIKVIVMSGFVDPKPDCQGMCGSFVSRGNRIG
jgi:DNA-binding NtrC family response regulator